MDKRLFQYRKTYNAGLLQAKAFRILKKHTNTALKPYDISATEWGILGLLQDERSDIKLSDIASALGVKAPFITRSMAVLLAKGYVTQVNLPKDARVRIARLTPTGKKFVTKTEPVVAKMIKTTFANISVRNLFGYVMTLHQIVEMYQEDSRGIDLSHLQD